MAGIKMIVAVILALVGLYYLVAPDNLHVSTGLGFGLEHMYHQIIGVVLIILATALYMMKMKK